ncbi:MAG: Maf family protein [Magnetovibrio sp.]|nr:Maf family protein [Magnetovibrio sp.]
MAPPVILASASAVRRRLLSEAGVAHLAVNSGVDEAPIKHQCRAAGRSVTETAHALAAAKALAVSADQILAFDGRWYDKPADRAEAARNLRALGGRTHHLISGVVVAENGGVAWRREDEVAMTMRPLSEAFVETYLDAVGAAALQSVGAYQLEGLGAQLFEAVDGDFFTVLGLPLLPLLDYLRQRGALSA